MRGADESPIVVVDAANVIGSRPDGWWKDRAGAVARLRDELAAAGPVDLGGGPVCPVWILVVEGAARGVAPAPGVAVQTAPGSGDDTIVAVAARAAASGRAVVVVTADRELRRRVTAVGAATLGPGRLLAVL